ncbi:hypothetical protein [Hyphomonas sp.]|uniref:hypothetical protein n=1 Tax=Hyphomonas sp. TaxID=87 RepID=UPI003919CC7B
MVQAQLLSTLITRARLRVAELIRMLKALRPDDGGPLSEHSITMFIKTIIEPAEVILRHMLLLMAAQLAPHTRKPGTPHPANPRAGGDRAPQDRAPPKPRTPLFRLFDPAPRAPQTPPADDIRPARPRAPAAAKPKPTPAEALAALNAKFEARLAALTEAARDPDAAARRLLARVRRERPATCPISPVMPESLKNMRMPDFRETFRALTKAAPPVWQQLLDSS